ncbi:MAG: MarR family winged helix-turn-helix transcriptional regulator [Solirubrobacterales bacterium]
MRFWSVPTANLSQTEAKAWTGLLRAHAALVREVDCELRAAHGLPLSWYDVLREAASTPDGRIRMGELAARVMLTRAGLSGLVDRLERANLVERRPCAGDARGTYAVVTREGRRLLERADLTHRDAVRHRYTSHFDDAELELVGRVWERVAADGRPN